MLGLPLFFAGVAAFVSEELSAGVFVLATFRSDLCSVGCSSTTFGLSFFFFLLCSGPAESLVLVEMTCSAVLALLMRCFLRVVVDAVVAPLAACGFDLMWS